MSLDAGSMDEHDRQRGGGVSPTRVLIQSVARFRGADVTAVAAETAYYTILAIPPFLLFLIAAVAIASRYVPLEIVDEFEDTLIRMAPGETGELLSPLFDEATERADRGTTSFGMVAAMVVAMWSSSRAIGALLKGFHRVQANEGDQRSTAIRDRLVALVLAIVMAGLLTLSIIVFLFGGAVGQGIANWIGLGGTFNLIWSIASWPLMAGIVLVVLAVLYRYGSEPEASQVSLVSAGAVVATALWLVTMGGTRVYLLIIDVNSIFGALGSAIVLIVFFFIMSLALMLGAAVNATLSEDARKAG